MPLLNFTEIPDAGDASGGSQDTFELFARDFLSFLGYKITSGPDRGLDGGRDLIVTETRTGIGGQTTIRWLVSCKHMAHSGRSVRLQDETDIADRVQTHKCKGFVGFYSTIPSSSLTKKLEGLHRKFECQIFDREKIEERLLGSAQGFRLAERYFKNSLTEAQHPATVFDASPQLLCRCCEKNLLPPAQDAMIVSWEKINSKTMQTMSVVDVYVCCKGACDWSLRHQYLGRDLKDGWEDICDIAIPSVYFNWVFRFWRDLHQRIKYTPKAFKGLTDLMVALYPYVSRKPTLAEAGKLERLRMLSNSLPMFVNYNPVR